ncbi:MAG: glycosyltransferase family 2 protein [Chloroflexi bacterium]|nr:glycosyltransferase family 2 protein [Chloroflexota bacterium]
MDLSVIIVNYNTASLLRACLSALRQHPLRRGSMDVWVVDNGSQDDSAAMVGEQFPEVHLLANEVNRGFAAANNQAIRLSQGRYVLLLNPDTEVFPGTLDEMLRFMDEHPQAGVVGAQLLNPDGSVQTSCRAFPTLWAVFLRGSGLSRFFPRSRALRQYLMEDGDHGQTQEVDWLLGACLWMRRRTLDEVGWLDEGFFLYYEDIDWCYRARQAGWQIYYLPSARILHRHQRESARGINKLTWVHVRSIIRLFRKHDLAWF